MKSFNLEKDGIYIVFGLLTILYITYKAIYSFTDTEQVKSNAQLAIKKCGDSGVKSVSVDGFICQ